MDGVLDYGLHHNFINGRDSRGRDKKGLREMVKTDRRQVPPVMVSEMLVVAEQIAGINLISDVSKFFCHTVRHDDISFLLESFQIAN